jgi:hypothetical protein
MAPRAAESTGVALWLVLAPPPSYERGGERDDGVAGWLSHAW